MRPRRSCGRPSSEAHLRSSRLWSREPTRLGQCVSSEPAFRHQTAQPTVIAHAHSPRSLMSSWSRRGSRGDPLDSEWPEWSSCAADSGVTNTRPVSVLVVSAASRLLVKVAHQNVAPPANALIRPRYCSSVWNTSPISTPIGGPRRSARRHRLATKRALGHRRAHPHRARRLVIGRPSCGHAPTANDLRAECEAHRVVFVHCAYVCDCGRGRTLGAAGSSSPTSRSSHTRARW